MGWNPLNDIRYQVEKERALMPDNGLNEAPGLMNSILGGISGANSAGVESKKDAIKNEAGKRALSGSGYNAEELGLRPGETITEGKVAAGRRRFLEGQVDAKSETAFNRSLVPLTKQLEAQGAQFNAGLKSQEARYAHQDKQARLDRMHTQQLAVLSGDREMQIAQMNQDLANKQMDFDRETRQMDKRDVAIAQLMSSIGTLGGAFAL